MASINGTNVAAMIAPFDTADTFPTHDAKYGKGGYRSVDTIAERDAIPAARLTDGCVCYVSADKNEYRYNATTASWTKIEKGGGGGSSVTVVDNLESTSPTDALSANQGRELNKRTADLELKIDGKTEKEYISVEFKKGGYYNSVSNTELTTGTGVYCEGIDISNFRGKTICFEFSGMVSNSSRKSLLADTNGNVLSYQNENSAHDEGNGRYSLTFDISSNAARLYISTKQHTDGEVYVVEYQSGLNDKVNEIENELAVIAPSVIERKDIKNCTFEFGKISHTSGTNASNGDKKYIRTTDFFFCLKGTTIAKNVSFPSNLRVCINVYTEADNSTFEEFIQNAQIGSVNSYTFNKECFIRLDAAYVGGAEFSSADDIKDWIDLTTEETSLDKIERVYNKLENLSNDVYDKGYPGYFQKPLEDVISIVREKNLLSGANGDSFLFATDLHFQNSIGTSSLKNAGYTIPLARHIASKTNNKMLICGGDILTDDHTKDEALSLMRDFTNEAIGVFGTGNYRFVSGNHDNNVIKTLSDSDYLTDDELYAVGHKAFEREVVCDGKRYYYWDNQSQNIRYIVIAFNNVKDKPFGKDQFDWLAETLVNSPDGCRVVVIAHGLIDKFSSNEDPSYLTQGQYIMNLLVAHNNRAIYNNPLGGSYDFANAKGRVKIVIQGHVHADKIVDGDIPIVCVLNDSYAPSGARGGTYREAVIDCVDLDFSSNKAYFVRLGENNGAVREVTMA